LTQRRQHILNLSLAPFEVLFRSLAKLVILLSLCRVELTRVEWQVLLLDQAQLQVKVLLVDRLEVSDLLRNYQGIAILRQSLVVVVKLLDPLLDFNFLMFALGFDVLVRFDVGGNLFHGVMLILRLFAFIGLIGENSLEFPLMNAFLNSHDFLLVILLLTSELVNLLLLLLNGLFGRFFEILKHFGVVFLRLQFIIGEFGLHRLGVLLVLLNSFVRLNFHL
jgi:hypothetical protein